MAENQNPEQKARDKIDLMLNKAGWAVQSKNEINLSANKGVAIREYQTSSGPADYVLFVDKKPIGVIEAKREEEGINISKAEDQTKRYAESQLKYIKDAPLKFGFESTGIITQFTDYRDQKPRSRNLFAFFTPSTLAEWCKSEDSLRNRFQNLPELDPTGLRPAQFMAIQNLEKSFKQNRKKALIQMATGAGKTFTATTFIYRLLKFAEAKRILFLVDTKNLGEQAEQEFMTFKPTDDNRKFTELYNVQRLSSSYIAPDSQVCISTIQRLYSILKGEELDEAGETENPNEDSWFKQQLINKQPLPVEYNPKVPIETFDFIVIDECHRSIYNLWKQVLDYFDAFLIGLTATPDKRTFGFFEENLVSEYTYQESITDQVNVPYDVYTIETEVSKKGSVIQSGWYVDRRDKLTRQKRWQQEEEEIIYSPSDLDKKVVNTSQIRNIIREFKQALQTKIFPNRWDENDEYEVPKTLVFAKTDSHADDIIRIIREEFNEGNDFCKKITYKADEDPKSVLNKFRNDYYPRIAVTVDMIATGTDVKPLEVLLFMRNVKSNNYFEQMKGRGARTIPKDSFQRVTRTASHKSHFVIVDAVGVAKSCKSDSRPLERKPTIPLKDLLSAITVGVEEEDLFLSLANRLIRIEQQIKPREKERIIELTGGKSLLQITKDLLNAYDPDKIDQEFQNKMLAIPRQDHTPLLEKEMREAAQQELINNASNSFNGKLNEYIDNIRKELEQVIDHINIDHVTVSEWNKDSIENAKAIVNEFTEYLNVHKDEILALRIFYNDPLNRRNITFKMIREVLESLKADKPVLAPDFVWNAYTAIEQVKSKRPKKQLTILISLIRHACGIDQELRSFDALIMKNYKEWFFKQNKGKHNRFTPQQKQWLEMLRDHILSSYHIELDDLDYAPFNANGGRGKMYQLFGPEMNEIINELNKELVA